MVINLEFKKIQEMLEKLEKSKEDVKVDMMEFLGTLDIALQKVGSLTGRE